MAYAHCTAKVYFKCTMSLSAATDTTQTHTIHAALPTYSTDKVHSLLGLHTAKNAMSIMPDMPNIDHT